MRDGAVGSPDRLSGGRKSQLPRREQSKATGYPCRKVNLEPNGTTFNRTCGPIHEVNV